MTGSSSPESSTASTLSPTEAPFSFGPISGASQFADSKREITLGKHQVTTSPCRFRPAGPVAELRTAVRTRSAAGSQRRTHR